MVYDDGINKEKQMWVNQQAKGANKHKQQAKPAIVSPAVR